MPRSYKRPTNAAIASYAATYHKMGPSCGYHTSMTYGQLPSWASLGSNGSSRLASGPASAVHYSASEPAP